MSDPQNALSFRGKSVNLFVIRRSLRYHQALQLANEQRTLYGLRYHDHERYRCVEDTNLTVRQTHILAANIARTGLTDFVRL